MTHASPPPDPLVPPSRLSAHEVFRAGRKRRRRRRRRAAAAAMVAGSALAAVVAAGVFMLPHLRPQYFAGRPDTGAVVGAARADDQHLYIVTNACDQSPAALDPPYDACNELLASEDGGATWRSRGMLPRGPYLGIEAQGSRTLTMVTATFSDPIPSDYPAGRISADGGHRWEDLRWVDQPIDGIPDGGAPSLLYSGDRVLVVDPGTRRIQPLAVQPPLANLRLQTAQGAIWVVGTDPDTRRGAVAVSRDGGRSWSAAELPGALAVPNDDAMSVNPYVPSVASWDGMTAYAILPPDYGAVTGPSAAAVPDSELTFPIYRSIDGGASWQLVEPPWRGSWAAAPWMTDDGRLVMGQMGDHDDLLVYDGTRFTQMDLPGLPGQTWGDGRMAVNADVVVVSDDGWTWREAWRSSICHLCPVPDPTATARPT